MMFGRRLTSDVYDAYAYKLGLGQRTGVEVGEAVGRLTTKSDSNYMASLDVQAAIGQGNTVVSPIQLATYAATLANNGTRYRTHFVKAILDTNTGEVLSETKPEVMDVIEGTGNTFELVRQGMRQVPSTISGKISSYPVPIACKTGTPQRSETYAPGKHYLNAMMVLTSRRMIRRSPLALALSTEAMVPVPVIWWWTLQMPILP